MQNVIKIIDLDLNQAESKQLVSVKENDSGRKLLINLKQTGRPYFVDDNCRVVIAGTRPDGFTFFNDAQMVDGRVLYTLTELNTSATGMVDAELRLYGPDDVLIATPTFTIRVIKSAVDDGQVMEGAEATALSQLITEAESAIAATEASVIRAAEASVNNGVGEPSAEVELIPGADGQTIRLAFENLKGADGYSPTVDVSKSGKTTTLTIADKTGTKTAEIMDGVTDYNELENKPVVPVPKKQMSIDGKLHYVVDVADLAEGVLYTGFGVHLNNPNYIIFQWEKDGVNRVEIARDLTVNGISGQLWIERRPKDYSSVPNSFPDTTFINDSISYSWFSKYSTSEADRENGIVDHVDISEVYAIKANVYTTREGLASVSAALKDRINAALEESKVYTSEALASYVPPPSDWNQSDPEKPGYIIGRTHYEEPDPDNSTDTLTWDGVIGDRFVFPVDEDAGIVLVKMADEVLTATDLIGGEVAAEHETVGSYSSTIDAELVTEEAGLIGVGLTSGLAVVSAPEEVASMMGIETGTYFLKMPEMYITMLRCANAAFGTIIIHPLPEKYIPEMHSLTLVSPSGEAAAVLTADDEGKLPVDVLPMDAIAEAVKEALPTWNGGNY